MAPQSLQFSQWPIHLNVNCKCYGIAALQGNIEFKSSNPYKMNRKKDRTNDNNLMIAYQSALILALYIEG